MKAPTTEKECLTFVDSVIKAANEVLTSEDVNFHDIYLQKHNQIPKSVKRNILKVERDAAVATLKEKDFVSLFASPQSKREWDIQRRDSYGVYKTAIPRSHISPIDTYKYSEGDLIIKLNETEQMSSINYTALAREVKLLNREGNSPSNSGQVSLK